MSRFEREELDESNRLDIARLLAESSLGNVHYLPETNSTNEVALQRTSVVPRESSELVLAGRQLRGKGRGTNRWWSGEGSLTFSLITPRLPLPRDQTPKLSLTTGLAICQAVEQAAPHAEARLKWPNDVYLRGRKAAGILIESPASPADRFVVGVGLNVNNRAADSPPEVRDRVVSLRDATGVPHQLTDVLLSCLRCFDACLQLLLDSDPQLLAMWRGCSLLEGRQVRLALPTEEIEGECRGVNEDGALMINTPGGQRACYGGEVRWWSE